MNGCKGAYVDTESDHRAIYMQIPLQEIVKCHKLVVPYELTRLSRGLTIKNNIKNKTYAPNNTIRYYNGN